ncbi:LuxR C-terminal-related transcriptional regulator [Streptomyces sp. NPDC002215]|uniref:LuxR C-terminal-related transcriptional regulator n=1 Tax=Streptomyces sp. NPDC002215 TaxID=3154412 RepID=UPI0033197CA4
MHAFPHPELLLSARQREIVGYRAAGLAVAEIAAELGVNRVSVHGHLRNARITAGVRVDRVLVYCVLAGRTVQLTRRTSLTDRPNALTRLVWRGLRYNVPDSELISTIAQTSLHPQGDVARALDELRAATNLPDCGLVGLAFATGLLHGDEGVEPGTAHTGLRNTEGANSKDIPRLKDVPRTQIVPERNHKPAQARKPQAIHRPHTSPADPLGLLPRGMPERHISTSPVLRWLQSRPLIVGMDVQAVQVSLELCADYLQHRYEQGIPRRQWGPVLGDTDGRCALFLLPPHSLPAQWSCADGRVLRNGIVLDLRPPLLPTSRMYWAFTPGAWWSLKQLTRLADRASSVGQALPNPSVTAIT